LRVKPLGESLACKVCWRLKSGQRLNATCDYPNCAARKFELD
jgi:hypothetical protein